MPAFGCRIGTCYEPSVAADGRGRLFVTDAGADEIAASPDGGRTFVRFPPPALPPGVLRASNGDGDAIVQARGDDLFFTEPVSSRVWWDVEPASPLEQGIDPAGTPVGWMSDGIHVARSTDGGRSWRSNVIVWLSAGAPSFVVGTDRPWLAFDPGRTVYLSYLQEPAFAQNLTNVYAFDPNLTVPTVVQVARSDDDGATFTSSATIVPPGGRGVWNAGAPVVDRSGRVYVPYFASSVQRGHPDTLEVARSDDGGRSFASSTAYDVSSSPCVDPLYQQACDESGGYFPSLAVDAQGSLDLAWWRSGDMIVTSRSVDHGNTWTSPRRWSNAPADWSPWALAPGGGRLDVAWFRKLPGASSDSALMFAQGRADGRRLKETTIAPRIVGVGAHETDTDYANFTLLPDRRAVLVWSNKSTVWVTATP